jgi:hypothetical protein
MAKEAEMIVNGKDIPVIEINMDKRCKKCRKLGVAPSGYCLKCASEIVIARLKAEKEGKK